MIKDLDALLDEYIVICKESRILIPYSEDYNCSISSNFYKLEMFKFCNKNLYLTIKKVYDETTGLIDQKHSGTWFWYVKKNFRRNSEISEYISRSEILENFKNKKIRDFLLFNFNYTDIKPVGVP